MDHTSVSKDDLIEVSGETLIPKNVVVTNTATITVVSDINKFRQDYLQLQTMQFDLSKAESKYGDKDNETEQKWYNMCDKLFTGITSKLW